MEYRRIKEMTERQFRRVLEREGKTVIKSLNQEEVAVLFRQVKGKSGENVVIYYTYDTNLKKGDIVEYKGYRYILTNENPIHNDVFKASVLKRCTISLNIDGRHIPMTFASDLFSDMRVSVLENLGLVTADTEDIRAIKRNSKYICFGGTYKVETVFYNDGLAYIYMKRDGDAIYGLQEFEYYGKTTFNLSDGKAQLRFAVVTGLDKIVWSEAEITYKSSNTNFAEVDENGWMTMKQKGVITITATCGDLFMKKTITIK